MTAANLCREAVEINKCSTQKVSRNVRRVKTSGNLLLDDVVHILLSGNVSKIFIEFLKKNKK